MKPHLIGPNVMDSFITITVTYQLYGIDQHGEVWVGLVLLNDGGTQRFTGTFYEHLYKETKGLLFGHRHDRKQSCSVPRGHTCGRSTDRN